jgi:hypothetical protein
MKNNSLLFIIFLIISMMTPCFSEEDDFYLTEISFYNDNIDEADLVSFVVDDLNLRSYEIIDAGMYDNGITYTVFKFNDSINITISVDESEALYIIGNVNSNEAMRDILDYLTRIYTEPIPYLNGDNYTAFFHDTEGVYIKDNFVDYIGTFTLYGNYLLIEEVIKQEKMIVQRQWCTSDSFDEINIEYGSGWGFITPWDNVEYITEIENQKQKTLPAQYTVRSWRRTGDSLAAIAAMPFIYGDSRKWRVLYEANKRKLPRPNNPNLIYPGMVLDIQNLEGENRSGMWKWD